MQKHFSFLLLTAFFVVLAGCDSGLKTYPVSGTVTYDGQPLAGATVGFSPKNPGEIEGDGGIARTDDNGFYQLQMIQGRAGGGTTPGEYHVTVSKVENVGTGTFTTDSDGNRLEEDRPVSVIPEKYGGPDSGLSATVEKKNNVINFEL